MSLRERVSLRQVLVTLVVLGVVFPFAAYAAPALVGADASYVVLTGSMRPAIAPGDVVFVSATPAAAIGVGDVITFDRGGEVPTTHRVIEVVEEDGVVMFRTQGDANEDPDAGIVTEPNVIGVVTLTIPFLGSVITAIDTQYGFVALVVLPFALLVLDVAYGAVKARRGGDERETTGADAPAGSAGGAAAAATADRPLPEVYDPVRAAEAYYLAAAALDGDRADTAAATSAVTGRDMTASIAVAVLLVAYAAWNAYWQITTLDAPRPETMSVLSGALVGLAFLVYLRYSGDAADPADPADPEATTAAEASPEATAFVPAAVEPAATGAAGDAEVYRAD
ncbi:signal peptidase I [Halobaculum lipolyticum]|uniref:Signal peptidase I n=1 Tax=Halobaculum lipolyticum TaxID=3032001 RepID=A0ABD5WCU2_9EURY|nr:signal peptidase I [Halobaculum sp. DT31]